MYYKLNFAIKKIGKKYPQLSKLRKGTDVTWENCVVHLNSHKFYFEFPMLQPDFTCFEIHKTTPFTDIMSSFFYNGFVINEKVKKIFEAFYIHPNHKFYPIKLIDFNGQTYEYYWFHLIEPSIEGIDTYIDYSMSEFVASLGMDYKSFKVSSLDDFNKKTEAMKKKYKDFFYTYGKNIKLKKKIEYDMFRLFEYSPNNTFISQNLYDVLTNEKVTGIDIVSSIDISLENLSVHIMLHPPTPFSLSEWG